jgi:sec-independent protein translocase protein TatB
VFNLQGSELVIILLLALVVLGPEKLPDAMRKLGEFFAQLKKMSSGFQQEFKSMTDEPLREIRETATALRDSVDFRNFASGEREEKPKSAEMFDATPSQAPTYTTVAPGDPTAVPVSDVPFPEVPFAAPSAAGRVELPDPVAHDATPGSRAKDPVDVALETLPDEET